MENRLIDIEIALTNIEKMLEDINSVVIDQGKKIDRIEKQYKILLDTINENDIKPLEDETPPPHY